MTDMELLRLADKYGVTAVTKFEWNFDKQRFDNGMTLRDYFAAQAMQALIDNDGLFSEIPTQAYKLADAMMKAREA